MGAVKDLLQSLLEQGFSQIEAEMEIAHYNLEAEQLLSEVECEVF